MGFSPHGQIFPLDAAPEFKPAILVTNLGEGGIL
jgi:hypothetical protein